MVALRDLEPAQANHLAGREGRHAEDTIQVRSAPLEDGIEQHRGPVHHVLRRDAAPSGRPADLPVVGGAPRSGGVLQQVIEKHRLLIRTREQLLGRPRVEDLAEAFEGRTPVAQHGSHPPYISARGACNKNRVTAEGKWRRKRAIWLHFE